MRKSGTREGTRKQRFRHVAGKFPSDNTGFKGDALRAASEGADTA
jgi:hypothetical protein